MNNNDLGIVKKISEKEGTVSLLIDNQIIKFYFSDLKKHSLYKTLPISRKNASQMAVEIGNKYKLTLIQI